MGTVIVDGKVYHTPDGEVEIRSNGVFIDGKPVKKINKDLEQQNSVIAHLVIRPNDRPLSVKSETSVEVNGSVKGDVSAGSSVSCGEVEGDVSAGSSVSCGHISGDVSAGSSISCGNISGNATAGRNITKNFW